MFGLFKKKKKEANEELLSWSFLGTDIHSHFIPAIDDGPAAMADSLTLLQQMSNNGFRRLITTPHISADYYPNTRDKILKGLEGLTAAAAASNIPVQIEAAAEYMIDEAFARMLHNREPLLFFGDHYVLVEMGFIQPSPMLQQVIFELQALGYKPVLAHPERYAYYHRLPLEELALLKESGCLFQLNAIALSGYYGKDVNTFASKMLKGGLYDLVGSDIHHERHLKAFNSVLQQESGTQLKNYPFLNSKL
jgi:tyrosine-protein phosphatase YwqE